LLKNSRRFLFITHDIYLKFITVRMNTTLKLFFIIVSTALSFGWESQNNLEGTWQFSGGIYNGKQEGGTEGYKLQRKYKAHNFEAYLIEEGLKPQKFQAGNYKLISDSCFETETFNSEPSNLSGVMLRYHYQIKNDTLTFKGKLPSGMDVEEYWTRVK
jgi:hypothetical protein